MISTVINPKGTARYNEFSRIDEYIFFVFVGDIELQLSSSDMLTDRDYSEEVAVRWRGLARTGRKGLRSNNPGSWYPIFVHKKTQKIHSIGDAVPLGVNEDTVDTPEGTIAVWPKTEGGQQYSWSTVPETLRERHALGGFKTGRINIERGSFPFYYLSSGILQKIEDGEILVTGRNEDGELSVRYADGARAAWPRTIWNQVSHDAGSHGTGMLKKLIPGRNFPFPKSLYAVEDALRFFVKNRPNAVIIDFFGGSGTTAHAVARLNRQDDGCRQSITITNNAVSAEEDRTLRKLGHRPGDVEYEVLGIFEHITRPRIIAAITGRTPDGGKIEGEYGFADEFPISEGFSENVEFFRLSYLDPSRVELNIAFEAVAPLLWLRAGGRGSIIDTRVDANGNVAPYSVTEDYGILFNTDNWRSFADQLPVTAKTAYVVTDSATIFSGIAAELQGSLDVVRLYENYLTMFTTK